MYLSEHDSGVLKETRARETSPFHKNALSKVQREGKDDAARPKKEAAAPSSVQTGQNGGARPHPRHPPPHTQAPQHEQLTWPLLHNTPTRHNSRHIPRAAERTHPQ